MPTYSDTAVVLRTVKLGEADRIVTLLMRERGCVRAVARGVRRTASRFGARLEPGSHVDLMCYEGRNLDTVTQVVSIRNYGAVLAPDYGRWTTAQAMIETAEKLVADAGPHGNQHYLLLVGGLRTLADGIRSAGLVLDSYLLRALSISGWAPSFGDCAGCGRPGPHRAFDVAQGGSVCGECRSPGSARATSETVALLGALLAGDWGEAEASGETARRQAAGLTAAYLQWHLEHRVRSLRLVERHLTDGSRFQ